MTSPTHGAADFSTPGSDDSARAGGAGGLSFTEPAAEARWFRGLVDHATDIIAAMTPEGEIVSVNEAVTQELGWEPSEILGADMLRLVHPEDRDIVTGAMEAALRNPGERRSAEVRLKHSAGGWLPFESRGVFIPRREGDDEGAEGPGGHVVILSRNVTDRREAERSRDQALEKYHTFFELFPVGIVLSDPESGAMYEANDRFRDIFGYAEGEVVGRTSLDLGMWDDRERRSELVERARDEKGFRGEEAWFRTKEGERRPMRLSSRRLELAGEDLLLWTVRDVTEERKRQARLELLESAAAAAHHGLLITDRDGEAIWVNPAFEQMTGYALEKIRGKTPSVLKSGQHDDAFYEDLWETILAGERWEGEIVNRRKDGTLYRERQTIVPVRHHAEEITHFVALKEDITEQKEVANRFRQMAESIGEIFWLRDRDSGEMLYLSPAYEEIWGRSVEEVYRDPPVWIEDVHPEDQDRVRATVFETEDSSFELEYRVVRPSGETRWIHEQAFPVADETGRTHRIAGVARDVSDQKRLEEQLRHQALHDSLTGLPNRTLLSDRVERALSRSRREAETVGLLVLDVDAFKRINDSLGHTAGDRVLITIARRLQTAVREGDTVARWGGDEFVVVLPDLGEAEVVHAVRERIGVVLRRPIRAAGETVHVDVTIGGVVHGDEETPGTVSADDARELIRLGDLSLHRAKEQAAVDFHLFDPSDSVVGVAQIRRERQLRTGLERGDFVPHYQPIVRLEDGEVVGFEALVRWEHPEEGLLRPAEFLPLVEDLGLFGPLGESVIRRGFREATARWEGERGEAPFVGFNLSAQQFEDPALVDKLVGWLEEVGLAPERVVLEVTESSLIQMPASINELRSLGVRIWVDDFGTGYSTFSYLRDLRLDGLKIDMSFVQRIETSAPDAALIETMVGLGRKMDLTVVAEGIETDEQRRRLREIGCTLGQGYLFARPGPGDECWKRKVAGGG